MAPGGVSGVLLAAGAGRRANGPKALRRDPDGSSWLLRSVRVLLDGGCRDVVVVLGADADRATAILDPLLAGDGRVGLVRATDWVQGMGVSLRYGLEALSPAADAACVHLVDLPDVGADVVARMIMGADRTTVARATYERRPGHPVVVGRDHVAAMSAGLAGDEGGRSYLADHGVRSVECGDLATGLDVDRPTGVSDGA